MLARSGSATGRAVGIIALAANILCWGLSGPIVKYGLTEISAWGFLYYRFLLVALLTTPILLIWKKPWRSVKSWKHVAILMLSGFFTNPLSLLLLFWGTKLTTAISATILSALAPLFILIAGGIFLKESLARRKVLGTSIALLGSLFILFDTPVQPNAPMPLLGNLLIFGSNLAWTAGILIMKKYANSHSPIVFGYVAWVLGMIVCGALTLFLEPSLVMQPQLLLELPKASAAILYMAIFGSLIAFPAYQAAQRVFPVSDVGLSNYALPIIGVPFASIWLHEQMDALFPISVLVMLLGVGIAESHRTPTHPTTPRLRKTSRIRK